MKRMLMIALFIPLWVAAGAVQATVIVLDSTNGYSATIEPGATIQQPEFTFPDELEFHFITGTNIQFAIGTSDVATFPGTTQIGDGVQLGGSTPKQLVTNSVEFTILATGSGNKYDAKLTYFVSCNFDDDDEECDNLSTGVAPIPDNNAGAVFVVELAQSVSVPAPATLALLVLGLAAIGFGRVMKPYYRAKA